MKLACAATALVFLLAGCSASTSSDGADAEEPDVGDEFGAQVICENFVEDQLRAPSTADFSDASATQLRGPTWEVTGAVDAENAFGAMLRSDYTCKVKYLGDDRWRLLNMSGLQ